MQSSPFKDRLPLPADPITKDTVCYEVTLPNDPRILEAFEGAVLMLGYWPYWARNTLHTGAKAAKVFLQLYDRLIAQRCKQGAELGVFIDEGEMNLRISPTNPCIIQCLDCNGNWTDWYDPTSCVPGLVTQPGGGTTVAPGECMSWDVVLQGNNKWRLPVQVQAGDTVQITGATGAWSDGTLAWKCPDGTPFALGACSGSQSFDGTDPCTAIYHGRLIAIESVGPTCHDAFNGTFTIVSTTASNLDFQQNDASLSDNAGSINFTVKYCRKASDCWQLDLNLLTSDGGFVPIAAIPDGTGQWISGQGWTAIHQNSASPDTSQRASGQLNFPGVTHLTRMVMTYSITRGTHAANGTEAVGQYFGALQTVNWPTSNGTNLTLDSGAISHDTSFIQVSVIPDYHVGGGATDGSGAFTHIHLEGTGARPPGAVDC